MRAEEPFSSKEEAGSDFVVIFMDSDVRTIQHIHSLSVSPALCYIILLSPYVVCQLDPLPP